LLLFQATPAAPANVSQDVIEALTKRTQDGGTEVVTAKAGKVGVHQVNAVKGLHCCELIGLWRQDDCAQSCRGSVSPAAGNLFLQLQFAKVLVV